MKEGNVLETEMHDLMYIFGGACYNGAPLPFESTDIEVLPLCTLESDDGTCGFTLHGWPALIVMVVTVCLAIIGAGFIADSIIRGLPLVR